MFEKVKKFLEVSGVMIGGFLAIMGLIAYFGLKIQTPTGELDERMSAHIESSNNIHNSIIEETDSSSQHTEHIEGLLIKLNKTLDETLLPVVRGECLENSRERLGLQGLLQTCQALGIVPTAPGVVVAPAPSFVGPDTIP